MSKFAAFATLLLSCFANAEVHVGLDQVAFNVRFEVERCAQGHCVSDNSPSEDIVLNFSFTDWVENAVVQHAYWAQVIGLGVNNFATSISVKRTLSAAGEWYELKTQVGPVFGDFTPAEATVMMGASKALPKPLFLEGPVFEKDGISYRSLLRISPI